MGSEPRHGYQTAVFIAKKTCSKSAMKHQISDSNFLTLNTEDNRTTSLSPLPTLTISR